MKNISMLLVLLGLSFYINDARAEESITSVCNGIIKGPNNIGPSIDIVVAKYRRMCSDLAKEQNLTARELKDSDCDSFMGSPYGARPEHGYSCLEARFGKVQTQALHGDDSSSISCEVKKYGTLEAFASFDVPQESEMNKTVQINNALLNINVGFYGGYIDISTSLTSNPEETLHAEGYSKVLLMGALEKKSVFVICSAPGH